VGVQIPSANAGASGISGAVHLLRGCPDSARVDQKVGVQISGGIPSSWVSRFPRIRPYFLGVQILAPRFSPVNKRSTQCLSRRPRVTYAGQ